MKIHNKLIKSKTVTEKTDLWGNFITTILTRTCLHKLLSTQVIRFDDWFTLKSAYLIYELHNSQWSVSS